MSDLTRCKLALCNTRTMPESILCCDARGLPDALQTLDNREALPFSNLCSYTINGYQEMRFKSSSADVAQGLANLDQKGGNTNLSVASQHEDRCHDLHSFAQL